MALLEPHLAALLTTGKDGNARLLEYLTIQDLGSLCMVCKQLHSDPSVDSAWKWLCCRRWYLKPKNTHKTIHGANSSSMKEVYKLFHQRNQIPHGHYTNQHNIVFGKVFQNGMALWLLIGHGTTGMLKPSKFQGTVFNRIELRLCIQNVSHIHVRVPMTADTVEICCNESEEVKDGRLLHTDMNIVAINGIRSSVDSTASSLITHISLGRFEFAVFSFVVYCPESIESEPDFLTMIDNISLKIPVTDIISPVNVFSTGTHVELTIRKISDESVWSHYQILPNGLVMVRDEQNNW